MYLLFKIWLQKCTTSRRQMKTLLTNTVPLLQGLQSFTCTLSSCLPKHPDWFGDQWLRAYCDLDSSEEASVCKVHSTNRNYCVSIFVYSKLFKEVSAITYYYNYNTYLLVLIIWILWWHLNFVISPIKGWIHLPNIVLDSMLLKRISELKRSSPRS